MKRRGWVIDEIAEMENLRLAFWKAKRGKACDREVIGFGGERLQQNLKNLQYGILSGNVETGNYRYFTVYEPKERLVCVAPFSQRVLHHAIINICHNDFERVQIYDSYATRYDKGIYKALQRAFEYHKKYRYCLKLDIRKYFDSIDHNILKAMLEKLYKEKRLLNLFNSIIESYNSSSAKGLPIGNLTSQYFANFYLAFFDHAVKEMFKAKGYVRYMDDMLLWDNDRENLIVMSRQIVDYLENNLNLKLKIIQIKPTMQNTTFLGYRLSKDRMSLSKRSVIRYQNHIKSLYYGYDNGMITQEDMNRRLQPILAFVNKVESKHVRKKAMEKVYING